MAVEEFSVAMQGGAPWGIRLQGGAEFRAPLRIAALTAGGKADRIGLKVGDYLEKINETSCMGLKHSEAQKTVKLTGKTLNLSIRRGSSTPSVLPQPSSSFQQVKLKPTPQGASSLSPERPTSLSAGPQPAVPPPQTEPAREPSPPTPSFPSPPLFSPTETEFPSLADLPPPPPPAAFVSSTTESSDGDFADTALPSPELPPPVTVTPKKFEMPSAPGRGPRRLTSGSDVTDGSVTMEIQSVPTQTSHVMKTTPKGSGPVSKPPGWYRDMFRSIHMTDSSHFRGDGSSDAFQDPKDDRETPVERKQSGSEKPPQTTSSESKPLQAVSTEADPKHVVTVRVKSKSPPYHSPATVTVGGDPEAIVSQTTKQPMPPNSGRLSGTAGSIYKLLQSGGEIPSGGLANLPREPSPRTKRKSYDMTVVAPKPSRPSVQSMVQQIRAKSTSPSPPPPSKPVKKSRSVSQPSGTVATKPPVTSPSYSSRATAKSKSPSPISVSSTLTELHTSSLVVEVNNQPKTDASAVTVKPQPVPPTRKEMSPLSPSTQNPKSPLPGKGQARAKFRFKAESVKELEFGKGAVLTLNRQVDEHWFEGEFDGRKGIFPIKYVEVLVPLPEVKKESPPPSVDSLTEPTARGKYKFNSASAKELSFRKGDLITLIRRVDDNWFEGKIGVKKGIFPVTYVEVLKDVEPQRKPSVTKVASTRKMSAPGGEASNQQRKMSTKKPGPARPSQPPSRTPGALQETIRGMRYIAQFSYSPENRDELELEEEDIIYVVEQCDDGWYVGTSQRSGKFGTFPGNYVELAET